MPFAVFLVARVMDVSDRAFVACDNVVSVLCIATVAPPLLNAFFHRSGMITMGFDFDHWLSPDVGAVLIENVALLRLRIARTDTAMSALTSRRMDCAATTNADSFHRI
jgi:hypothetical protein